MSSFNYDNTNIYFTDEGAGKPVLLVHGFGEDSSVWDLQKNYLKEHCRVITIDLPGSGISKYNSNLKSIEDFAVLLNDFIAHLQLNEIILLGHSMGGYITLAYAEKFSGSLRAFGLIHSTAFADTDEKKETRKKAIDFMQKNGTYSFLKTSTPNLFSASSKETMPDTVNSLVEKGKDFEAGSLTAYYQAMIDRPDRNGVLSSSERPVLFILGTEDTAAPMADVLKQVYLPQTAYVHILDNVGHMSMLEAPEILNSHLLKFINEV